MFSRELKKREAVVNRNSNFTIETSLPIQGLGDALRCWRGLEVWDMASSAIDSLRAAVFSYSWHRHLIDARA